jgi:hypothetical protein
MVLSFVSSPGNQRNAFIANPSMLKASKTRPHRNCSPRWVATRHKGTVLQLPMPPGELMTHLGRCERKAS